MAYLLAIVLFIETVVSYKINKTIAHPGTLFLFFWFFVVLLAALRLFEMDEVSGNTLFVIFLGVNSFVFGANQKVRIGKRKEIKVRPTNNQGETFIGEKAFWAILVVSSLFLIPEIIQTVNWIKQGYTMDVIRSIRLGLVRIDEYTSNYLGTLSSLLAYFRSGFQTILVASGIEYYFMDVQRNKKYLFSSIILTISEAIIEGGRWTAVYFIVEFLICYFVFKKKSGFSFTIGKREKKRIIIILLISVFGVWILTRMRIKTSTDELFSHYYYYFCGCVPLLDKRLAIIDSSHTFSVIFSGLYGLFYLVSVVITYVFHLSLPFFWDLTNPVMIEQQVLSVGAGREMNAFVTSFYTLYADFRYLGVFLGMLFWGYISGFLFARSTSKKERNSIVPYLVFAQLMIKSIQVYPFSNPKIIICIILLWIINYVKKKTSIHYSKMI